MTKNRKVLICGETVGNRVTAMTAELICLGRKICDALHEPLHLHLIGDSPREAAKEAVSLGADTVHLSPGPPFAQSHPEHVLERIIEVAAPIDPFLILLGQTDMGRETAPRLAARLDASVCLDCIQVEIDPETGFLQQTKPVFGGNAMAVWESSGRRPHITTLRPRSYEPARPDSSRTGEIIEGQTELDDSSFRGKLLKTVKEDDQGIRLEDAKTVVTGGGGIGGKEGFQMIQELAGILHGAVGVSRVPCDEGWMPKSQEIGQTGRVVGPDLYFAVGISGAPQHMAGCSGSKRIVAINKNPEAHIFNEADFGIVGDYREALPAFIEKLKSLLGS